MRTPASPLQTASLSRASLPLFAALLVAITAAAPSLAQTRIGVGETARGTLSSSDARLADDSYYDAYTLSGRAGERVVVTLRSDDFDAYLDVGRVSDGSFTSIETDDDGGGTDSRIELTLPASGEYVIRANSLAAGVTGRYTLVVDGNRPSPGGGSRGDNVVGLQLDEAVGLMGREGLSPQGGAIHGSLSQGGSTELTMRLDGGGMLSFISVCDVHCTDVDLVVYGPDKNVVGSDELTDDTPIVLLENARSGVYRVEVSMPGCNASSCGFGVQAFGD